MAFNWRIAVNLFADDLKMKAGELSRSYELLIPAAALLLTHRFFPREAPIIFRIIWMTAAGLSHGLALLV